MAASLHYAPLLPLRYPPCHTLLAPTPNACYAGKYVENGQRPYGPRKFLFSDNRIREVQPLLNVMRTISEERGKSMAQVWNSCEKSVNSFKKRGW